VSAVRGIRQAALLIVIALLALAPAALGQPVKPVSVVYIQVEPQGLGEVGYYPSPEPAGEWPRATTPIGSFFTIAFPQGTYLYLEARPYGCAELDRWEITPEDASWTYYGGSRERIILPLNQDYITVKAVFSQIPGDKCPYIPVWRSIRIRWSDLVAGAVIFAVIGAVTGVAYAVKKRAEGKREEEEKAGKRIEEVREKLLDRVVDWRRPAMIAPWQVILFTCLKWPGLEEANDQELGAALMDDAILKRLRDIQSSGIAGLGHCYIADAMDMYTGNIPLLGLKTYLALFNLAPSTDEITKMYLTSLDPDRLPLLWYDVEGERELRRMLELIRRNMRLQRRGLQRVYHLMRVDPRYARRIREPPEYYAELLRFIQGWTAENLGITFKGIRLVSEIPVTPKAPEMELAPPVKPVEWEAEKPVVKEVRKPVKEVEGVSAEHEERIVEHEEALPDHVPSPKWLADALDHLEKEEGKEVAAEKPEEKVEVERPVEAPRRIIEERKAPPIEVAQSPPPKAPEPTAPPARPEEGQPEIKPAAEAAIPVSWDELPRPLQRQIEDLGLTFEDAAAIAMRTMGRGEKEVYREVDRLLSEKYPDMSEQDMISTLMMAVNTITWLQGIMEEVKQVEVKGAKPIEEATSQVVERPLEERVEEVKPEEVVKAAEHVEERVEEARVEETEEIEKSVEEVEGQPVAVEAAGAAAPKEAGIYDEVRVDRIEVSRPPIRVAAREVYLIDMSGMSASWIPTSLIAEMFHGSSSCKPVTFERRRHYSRDVVEELFIVMKKMCMIGGTIPVIVIGRPGYTFVKEGTWVRVKNSIYVEKLRQLLSMLREAKVGRYAVAMPFQVYKQYCMNMQEPQAMRKVVYVIDVDGIVQELSGKIPDGALPHLRIVASLSPTLLQELQKSPRQVTWKPSTVEGTGEEEALAWAVRTIYSKGGPLTVEEVDKAGYMDYLDRLIILGMVERR
jgi:hypothetical protein